MNKSARITLIVIGAITLSALLFYAGFGIATNRYLSGESWMGSNMGRGMMSGARGSNDQYNAYGMGMMSASMMGGFMGGMMGFDQYTGDPISLDRARQALDEYIISIGNEGLFLGEIMIFENHAYAQIIEESSGIGAMEVLVDPVTFSVYPEYGPNMMWNQKYGAMGAQGMMGMGNMMGSSWDQDFSGEMEISADQALVLAQQFLDKNSSELSIDEQADEFYGYFTIHIWEKSEIIGMLSVNGYSGEVFPHNWHGDFVEMSE